MGGIMLGQDEAAFIKRVGARFTRPADITDIEWTALRMRIVERRNLKDIDRTLRCEHGMPAMDSGRIGRIISDAIGRLNARSRLTEGEMEIYG